MKDRQAPIVSETSSKHRRVWSRDSARITRAPKRGTAGIGTKPLTEQLRKHACGDPLSAEVQNDVLELAHEKAAALVILHQVTEVQLGRAPVRTILEILGEDLKFLPNLVKLGLIADNSSRHAACALVGHTRGVALVQRFSLF